MAYLKSPSAAWQARPGFSGLGAVRRRRLSGNPGGWPTAASVMWGASPVFAFPNRQLPVLTPGNGAQPIVADGGTLPTRGNRNGGPIVRWIFDGSGGGSSTTNTGAGSTAANVSGTPVPVGYPTNQIYVEPGGAFWEFSAASGVWKNVGTPYNVGGSASQTSTTSGSLAVPGAPVSPVPAGYPTNSLYTYTDGSVWQYNAAAGGWVEVQGPSTTTSALTPSGTPAAAAAPAVMAMPPVSSYQSILDWLSGSTLISGVPNWIIAAGAGFAAIKLMNPKRGR